MWHEEVWLSEGLSPSSYKKIHKKLFVVYCPGHTFCFTVNWNIIQRTIDYWSVIRGHHMYIQASVEPQDRRSAGIGLWSWKLPRPACYNMWPNLHKPTICRQMLFFVMWQYSCGVAPWLIFCFPYKWTLLRVSFLLPLLPELYATQTKCCLSAVTLNGAKTRWRPHHCHGNLTPRWHSRQLTG